MTNYRLIEYITNVTFVRISHCFEDTFREYAFAYREHHGPTLVLTASLNSGGGHVIVGIGSIGLSKAFVTLQHELILASHTELMTKTLTKLRLPQ